MPNYFYANGKRDRANVAREREQERMGKPKIEWRPCENCVSRVSFSFFNRVTLASRDEKRVNVNRERERERERDRDENDKCSDTTILHIRARVCVQLAG